MVIKLVLWGGGTKIPQNQHFQIAGLWYLTNKEIKAPLSDSDKTHTCNQHICIIHLRSNLHAMNGVCTHWQTVTVGTCEPWPGSRAHVHVNPQISLWNPTFPLLLITSSSGRRSFFYQLLCSINFHNENRIILTLIHVGGCILTSFL